MAAGLTLITCPNPKCHRKIEELAVVTDQSTERRGKYYACPHCFTKLDVASTPSRDLKEDPPCGLPEGEAEGPSRCAGYFGYLAVLPERKPIPSECLVCPRVLDCAMKTGDS